MHILKQTFNLSDEEVCARWVENPYYQYFTGEYFPHDRSSMTRWRSRVREEDGKGAGYAPVPIKHVFRPREY